jgi:hypothetical protein
MSKLCIFSNNKLCSDCGECDRCDLVKDKICDSCGNCLKTTSAEFNEVLIDEINDIDTDNSNDEVKFYTDDTIMEKKFSVSTDDEIDFSEDFSENNETWELIDDVQGLSEVLELKAREDSIAKELFPGFIFIDKDR